MRKDESFLRGHVLRLPDERPTSQGHGFPLNAGAGAVLLARGEEPHGRNSDEVTVQNMEFMGLRGAGGRGAESTGKNRPVWASVGPPRGTFILHSWWHPACPVIVGHNLAPRPVGAGHLYLPHV